MHGFTRAESPPLATTNCPLENTTILSSIISCLGFFCIPQQLISISGASFVSIQP